MPESPFPVADSDALVSASWVFVAAKTVARPTRISDIINQVADSNGLYQPKTGWRMIGLAGDEQAFGVEMESEEATFNNAGLVLRRITAFRPSVTAQFASINSENMKILYNARRIVAVAAGANQSAESQVPFGGVSEIDRYRIALIAQRAKSIRAVTEPGGRVRGAMIVNTIYNGEITPDESSSSFNEEDPANFEAVFTGSADKDSPALPAGEDYGGFWEESAGTITAV